MSAEAPAQTSAPSSAPSSPTSSAVAPAASRKQGTQQLPPYNVILLDDDHHTYEYVIQMLRRLCGHPETRGMQLAKQVDSAGRAIVLTTHKELAELKRDQIHAFGADPRMAESSGSMSAVIEPAPAN